MIYITAELARMGHHVEVYADPPAQDHCMRVSGVDSDPLLCTCSHTGGVCWFHYSEFDVLGDSLLKEDVALYTRREDGQQVMLGSTDHTSSVVFMSWRYPLSLQLGRYRSAAHSKSFIRDGTGRAAAPLSMVHHVYLWVHDLLPHIALPPLFSGAQSGEQLLRRLFVQSSYHRYSLPEHLDGKYRILPNGISTDILHEAQLEILAVEAQAQADVDAGLVGNAAGVDFQDPALKNELLNTVLNGAHRAHKFVYGR